MLWRIRSPTVRSRPPAEFILPGLPVLSKAAPSGPDWIHEVKHDGYRLVARKDVDRVRLWTRQAVDYTDRFIAIADAVRVLPVDACVIDREAVVYAEEGTTSTRCDRASAGLGLRATLRSHVRWHLL